MFSFLIIKEMVNVQRAQEARGASFALWATSRVHPYKLDGGTLHVYHFLNMTECLLLI